MLCYICRNNFASVDVLVGHLKVIHGFKKNNVLICTKNGCGQLFNRVSVFKQHTKNLHSKMRESETVP